jgi:glycosyltransferase involved in cell wall biosynthesis
MAPFLTALVSVIRNIPFYILVFDLYPEALQQAGIVGEGSWLYRVWQNDNRRTFSKALGLITLSESMKQAVSKYIDPAKVAIIPNWADTEYVRPVEKSSNGFMSSHGLDGKFVVMYSGNMGLTHDLESLLGAANILAAETNIRFVLIGEGGKRKKLEALKLQMQLDNVIFLPYQDAKDFPLAMAAADVGIITLGTGAEGISVPSKTYVNMAAGLAIIAISPAHSELNRIVDHFAMGYVVMPGEPERIAAHVRSLAANPDELQTFKSRSRAASMNFTPENAKQYVAHMLGA